MNRKTVQLFPLLFLIVFMVQGVSAQTDESRGIKSAVQRLDSAAQVGKQYLVLIGIDDYLFWTPLANPVKDAKEVRDIIVERYHIDDVIELYNNQATMRGIRQLFTELQQKVKENDSVLIFYAGHGHLDTVSNTGFWIPIDGGDDEVAQDKWLSNSVIRGMIDQIPSKRVLLISDSCFSGDLLNATRSFVGNIDNEYYKKSYAMVARQAITSGASETVPDQSEFAVQLKRALRFNNRPYLDAMLLFVDLRDMITKTTPLFGILANTRHQDGGNFLLFLKQEFATQQLSSNDRSYFTQIYGDQLGSIDFKSNDLVKLAKSYAEAKDINQKANFRGLNTIVNQSLQVITDIERNVGELIGAKINEAENMLKETLFAESVKTLEAVAKYTKENQFQMLSNRITDKITEVQNKQKDFSFNIKNEYTDLRDHRYNSFDELNGAFAKLDTLNLKVGATKTIFNEIEPEKNKTIEHLNISKKILDIKRDKDKAGPIRTGMISSASICMGLAAVSGGLIGGFYGLNQHYLGLYVTNEQNYVSGAVSFNNYNSSRTELGGFSNGFSASFIAMIPVSAVFLIVSMVLYAVAPYETRYIKQLEFLERRFSISADLHSDKATVGFGLRL